MRSKCFLITVCGICLFLTARATLPDSVNTIAGVWVLDSVKLYKYTGTDSIPVNTDLLHSSNAVSGVFDTLSFSGDKCKVKLNKRYVESHYRKKGNILSIAFALVSNKYIVLDDRERLILYRKYHIVDNGNVIHYGVKMNYLKKSSQA